LKIFSKDRRYSAMFGLTSEEVKDSLRLIFEENDEEQVDNQFKIMEKLFDGYCFTQGKGEYKKVFNTNTCLEFFSVSRQPLITSEIMLIIILYLEFTTQQKD
jgi:hypothetical protein